MSDTAPIMTLDGPGGAGKGTLASSLARELGWWLLDSGCLYRLVALSALRASLDPDDAQDCRQATDMARGLDVYFEPSREAGQVIKLAGEDVTEAIRDEAVSEAASRWASQPAIREALLARHQAFVAAPGLIGDGRDLGTVIFPNAELKLFVTASARERAQRRYDQLSQKGVAASIDQIYREIVARDERDASRKTAPLKPADDAWIIDTTGEDVATSLARVRRLVADKGWLSQ